ncbi:NIPSNAP family protein [Dactylosporangium matsuzakiense]|uniref:NIPSNAP family protein n=1 Tax=Dactylosporangium matsuzakiense TaxID=53360 RepID=A0A9W6KAL8_9ACTN|nr:NIPSNAP family protein [Dactylosporangium matsuzakiense]UWZ47053.1 NIPSNAP family protein [Dactylosporangium matsuzakiense]GLK98516.1 NIPSNAP family protein [Dactylosporangium matsuzakiense]
MIVELRQYTLREGRRDELIDLFDREFVETQEELGMAVLGQFRDLDAPDRFVWLRAFPDMPSRRAALEAFYNGPVWTEHGPAANATMLDSDDVLLLRALTPLPPGRRGGAGPQSLLHASIWYSDRPFPDEPSTGPDALAVLRTEYAENTFPRLPVRAGEHVLVHLTRSPLPPAAPAQVVRAEHLRLAPTSRSALF